MSPGSENGKVKIMTSGRLKRLGENTFLFRVPRNTLGGLTRRERAGNQRQPGMEPVLSLPWGAMKMDAQPGQQPAPV